MFETKTLTVPEIIAALPEMARSASDGCGLVYELFAKRLSGAIDAAVLHLSEEDRQLVIAEARQTVGYETKAERAEVERMEAELGLCSHGLDEQTCPCGCFEGDDIFVDDGVDRPEETINDIMLQFDYLELDIEHTASDASWKALREIAMQADYLLKTLFIEFGGLEIQ